jgi:hypothetical protein
MNKIHEQIEHEGYISGLGGNPETVLGNWPHITDEIREIWLSGWTRGKEEKNMLINRAASIMGKKGGSAATSKKRRSSRENGKLGGRPIKDLP